MSWMLPLFMLLMLMKFNMLQSSFDLMQTFMYFALASMGVCQLFWDFLLSELYVILVGHVFITVLVPMVTKDV